MRQTRGRVLSQAMAASSLARGSDHRWLRGTNTSRARSADRSRSSTAKVYARRSSGPPGSPTNRRHAALTTSSGTSSKLTFLRLSRARRAATASRTGWPAGLAWSSIVASIDGRNCRTMA